MLVGRRCRDPAPKGPGAAAPWHGRANGGGRHTARGAVPWFVPDACSAAARPLVLVPMTHARGPDCVAEDWNFYGPKKDLASILNMTTLWFGNAQIKPGNKIFWYQSA